jgi:hypothetical protein
MSTTDGDKVHEPFIGEVDRHEIDRALQPWNDAE